MSEFINGISNHLKVSEAEAAFRTGLDNVKDFLVKVILILVSNQVPDIRLLNFFIFLGSYVDWDFNSWKAIRMYILWSEFKLDL